MSRAKHETCRHSTGNVGELIVYVKPSCPNYTKIRGSLVSSKIRCRDFSHPLCRKLILSLYDYIGNEQIRMQAELRKEADNEQH